MLTLNATATKDVMDAVTTANAKVATASNQKLRRGWYYDTSQRPSRLVVPESPAVTSCEGGSPQDVWGNLWTSPDAREHFFSCPRCQLWDKIENRW